MAQYGSRPSKLLSKRGAYGSAKCKAFAVLGVYRDTWLPARQLAAVSGIPYRSIGRLLPRWVRFGYVTRRPCLFGGDYEYRIEEKGAKWLQLAEAYLPRYQVFIRELEQWQSTLTDERLSQYMSMGFLEFVAALDEAIRGQRDGNK